MKKTQKQALAVGAGIAAIAAAAAGTYFFTGKKGAKNRAKVKKWVDDAKNDVVKQIKTMSNVTEKTYNQTVDAAIAKYKNLKDVDKSELLQIAKELKGHWDSISKQLVTKPVAKAEKAVKKAVNKVTKSVAKKVVKKPSKKK